MTRVVYWRSSSAVSEYRVEAPRNPADTISIRGKLHARQSDTTTHCAVSALRVQRPVTDKSEIVSQGFSQHNGSRQEARCRRFLSSLARSRGEEKRIGNPAQ
jgi:hypothetical protein